MTVDEFVSLCRELRELGVVSVRVDGAHGAFDAVFAAPEPVAYTLPDGTPHPDPVAALREQYFST